MKKYLLLFAGFLLVVAVLAWYVSKNQAVTLEGTAPEVIISNTKTATPTPTETTPPASETPPPTTQSPVASILNNVDIDVPFTAQAPEL